MKRNILISVLLFCCCIGLHAQEPDSTYFQASSNKSIYEVMPSRYKGDNGSVTIHQSQAIKDSLRRHTESNGLKAVTGYRVRIFFSNAQKAREESISTAERFSAKYPDYPVYRSYVNPNFKVTVGDFHTKSEALRLLSVVRPDFPAAFIVKETIN